MKNSPEKILVIRASSIGDILLATPLVRLLRQRFQKAQIDFVVKTQFADVLRSNPHIDNLYRLDTKNGRIGLKQIRKELCSNGYDLVVDIHNNFRSSYLRRQKGARIVTLRKYKFYRFLLVQFGWNIYRNIKPVYQRYIETVADYGIVDDNRGLEFFTDQDEQKQIDEMLRQRGFQGERLTICMAPGASKETKRWPVERFANVAEQLIAKHNAQIILLGDNHDAELTEKITASLGDEVIDLAGHLDIMQAACALSRADVALTNDSGLMHLATALGKPTVAVFGSTVRELGFFPVGENNIVVENNSISCRPCTHIGRHKCPKKHFKCMMDISAAAVLDALEQVNDNLCLDNNP
jgi:lipopolysaccharide heptosyltransferase II